MGTAWMMSACLDAAACAMGWLAAGISGRLDGRERSAHTTGAPSMVCWADAVGLRLTTNPFPSSGGHQHAVIIRDICPRCQSPTFKKTGRFLALQPPPYTPACPPLWKISMQQAYFSL